MHPSYGTAIEWLTEGSPRLVMAQDISEDLKARIERASLLAFRALKLRDYARIDFRISAQTGEPYILEVNPNPDFSPTAGLSGGLDSAGISHERFTVELVERALARGGRTTTAARCGS